MKKTAPRPISWMTKDEMQALLAIPNHRTLRGRNERTLLLFLYNTGARVSEATELQVKDLEIGRRVDNLAIVTLYGKGGKIRQCPLWPRTADALRDLVKDREKVGPVFLSRHRRPYTRFGIYRLVERYAARVPTLSAKQSRRM